jgi:hypothetical protein
MIDVELTAVPTTFLDHVEDVLSDFNSIIIILLALNASVSDSLQHM